MQQFLQDACHYKPNKQRDWVLKILNPLVYARSGFLRRRSKNEEWRFFLQQNAAVYTHCTPAAAFINSLIGCCAYSDAWWNAFIKFWKPPTQQLSTADLKPEITAFWVRNWNRVRCSTSPWPKQRLLVNSKSWKWSLYVKVHILLKSINYS